MLSEEAVHPTYFAHFEPSDEGGFVVTFPDFGIGVTQGETEKEARTMAADLLACLIEDLLAHNQPLPPPKAFEGPQYQLIAPMAMAADEGIDEEYESRDREDR